MHKLRPGAVVSRRQLTTTRSQPVQLPDPTGVVHLQFRRYAGCPFCNLHLRSVAQRHQEIVAAGIREIVVFQSSRAELLAQQGEVPFRRHRRPRTEAVRRVRGRVLTTCGAGSACLAGGSACRSQEAPLAPHEQARSTPSACGLPGRGRRPRPGVQVRRARLRPVVGGRPPPACQPAPPSHRPPGMQMIRACTLRGRPSPGGYWPRRAAACSPTASSSPGSAAADGPTWTPPGSWSRVRLGDHTPAQTLAGAALGGLVATAVFILLR